MATSVLWIVIVSGASALFSLGLACATPFAAIATIAGSAPNRRAALTLTGGAWLINQAIGYLLLGYPTTWDSFAWGGTIGIAALAAAIVVTAIRRIAAGPVGIAAGFMAAFVAYEGLLFAATTLLPSGDEAFSPAVVAWIFWTNLLALALLLALRTLCAALGLQADDADARAAAFAGGR